MEVPATVVPTTDTLPKRRTVIVHAIFFVLGFTLIFVAAGATASAVGQVFAAYRPILTRVFGVIVLVLGLNLLGVFRIPFLAMQKRLPLRRSGTSYAGSLLAGIGFAAGWTPCIGPVLAGVLALASAQESVGKGTALLFVYAAGMALPFLLLAFGLQHTLPLLARIKRFLPVIDVLAGLIVIGMGLLLVTHSWLRFEGKLYQMFPVLTAFASGPETYSSALTGSAAFAAGLISCASPCVLPLLPAYISLITGQSVEKLVAAYSAQRGGSV